MWRLIPSFNWEKCLTQFMEKPVPDLVDQFNAAMFSIYRRAKDEADYQANVFLGMLNDRGGIATAKYLINSAKPSDGYSALYERGRLDLTVEAEVVESPKWHSLFTADELRKARKRLADYRYEPKIRP
jgi:hypothetical protein